MSETVADSPMELADGAILRRARPGDEPGIIACIQALADYEREPDAVVNTPELLAEKLFGAAPSVFAHVIELDGEIVGIAVWFLNYSTWTGTNGIYLEDLIVDEALRGKGYGLALLRTLAAISVDRGYSRFEWAVLTWNTPSIEFYRSIGAVGMEEWRIQRLTDDALKKLAN
jgi:GNAT superfamily N-acetyltransferase